MKKTTLKKITAFVCALSLCFAMASCGKKDPENITESDVNAAISKLENTSEDNNAEGKTKIDPFETLEVSFSGKSPNAKFSMYDVNDKYLYGSEMQGYHSIYEFTADKTENLKNGDVVTVTAKLVSGEAKYYLTQTEKQFTVEGRDLALTKISDIQSSDLDSLVKKCDDQFAEDVKKWDKHRELKDKKFIGCCLDALEEGHRFVTSSAENFFYVVYKVDTKVKGVPKDSEDDSKTETIDETYYTYYEFESVGLNPDGSIKLDAEKKPITPPESKGAADEKFKHAMIELHNPYTFNGFSELNQLLNRVKVDGCIFDSTVDKNA